MTEQNPAGAEVPSKDIAGEIAVASQELLATPDGFFKREILQAMKRVVMHEGPHGPILRDDFAREADDAAEFHAPGFNVDGVGLSIP